MKRSPAQQRDFEAVMRRIYELPTRDQFSVMRALSDKFIAEFGEESEVENQGEEARRLARRDGTRGGAVGSSKLELIADQPRRPTCRAIRSRQSRSAG